jgi:prepilin-type N-terminal cleavage/methylation domain-containing protein/prepilin-type processing-associated H-X9-DG protein
MKRDGFTLIELLVVMAVVALLAALAIPAVAGAQERSRAAACSNQMRALGMAVLLYTQDNQGRFPRSSHSAAANREPGWAASIAPYLGAPSGEANAAWVNWEFRCPANTNDAPNAYSYAMNVFFELRRGDSYLGRPATWRCVAHVPRPARTILLAETAAASGGMAPDHFMAHQWSSPAAPRRAVAHDRHNGRANYLFVDGHVESLPVEATFVSRSENLWNPSVAGLAGSTP